MHIIIVTIIIFLLILYVSPVYSQTNTSSNINNDLKLSPNSKQTSYFLLAMFIAIGDVISMIYSGNYAFIKLKTVLDPDKLKETKK